MRDNYSFSLSILSILLLSLITNIQIKAQDNPLEGLSNLIGGKWVIDAKWDSGGTFHQEFIYEWGLNKKIIKTKTYGTINMETGEFGLRNEGIRAFNKEEGKINFWEFDVYGGIINGEVLIEGNDIHFIYLYPINGEVKEMDDMWAHVDDDKYIFKVRMKVGEDYNELLSADVVRVKKE